MGFFLLTVRLAAYNPLTRPSYTPAVESLSTVVNAESFCSAGGGGEDRSSRRQGQGQLQQETGSMVALAGSGKEKSLYSFSEGNERLGGRRS